MIFNKHFYSRNDKLNLKIVVIYINIININISDILNRVTETYLNITAVISEH